jgi:predicted MPP superfamily phosphohydrolase
MTASCSPYPRPAARQLAVMALVFLWLELGSLLALHLIGDVSWPAAVWQAAVCVLADGPLLLLVIAVLSVPKKLARFSRTAYRLTACLVSLTQYAIPWLGWAGLTWLMNRRLLPFDVALETAGAIAVFSYVSGFALVFLRRPRAGDVEITETDVPIPNLPPAFEGYRILHISDLHGGSPLSRTAPYQRLSALQSLTPDLVVFTGDLAAGKDALPEAASALARVQSLSGTVAVLGNHDHWMGEEQVTAALSDLGVKVLANSHTTLTRDGQTLYLVGVKDCSYVGRDDLPRALKGIPDGAPIVMLTHSPDLVYEPLARRASIILAGHTHGGQMVFPWIGALYVPTRLGRRRMSGLLTVNGTLLYVNRGLGEVFPPMRLNCPPELALLTLHRGGSPRPSP